MISNGITGQEITDISWSKVAVSAGEGFLTSGTSTVAKVAVKVGAAVAQSALDGNRGIKKIAVGTLVNLGSNAVGSLGGRMVKGVGRNGLQRISNKIIWSKTRLTKVTTKVFKVHWKKARIIATHVQNSQKIVARHVRGSISGTVSTVASGTAGGLYDRSQRRR